MPGFANAAFGGGFGVRGRGRGGGRGRRNWFYATGMTGWQRAAAGLAAFGAAAFGAPYAGRAVPGATTRDQEIDVLKRQAEYFAGALEEIKGRLEELQAEAQKS